MGINRQALSDQPKASSYPTMLLKTILMTIVGGPAAAAIRLIRERDQILLDTLDASEEKKNN